MQSPARNIAASCFVLFSAACVGTVGDDTGTPGTGTGTTRPGGSSGSTPGTSTPPGSGGLIDTPAPGTNTPPGAPAACKPGVPPSPRLIRLTRQQYENSVRALTGLTGSLAGALPQDPALAGFNRGDDLEVSDLITRVYRDQAETIARQVVATPASLKQVVGCETKDDACATTFINGFGTRTFRRPLNAADTQKYLGLFKQADTLVETGDAFTKGVQVVVEAMLQSPRFLYRAETSTKKEGALIPLTSYEVAQKLSFTLANVTPDAELLEAAAKNELVSSDKVTAHARRLLATPQGKATLRDFVGQWMGKEEWEERFTKTATAYTNMKSLLPKFEEELDLFFEEVTFGQKKGLTTLYTAPFTFVTKATAPYYDVTATSDQMTKVNLDPTKRSGVLTSVGFLAARAYPNRSSPIHRGVAIGKGFLCVPIPDPVPNIAPLPPSAAGKTMRQIVTEHTGAEGCKQCHYNFINPLGFGLENFDEAGKWRDKDMGQTVDASGSLVGTTMNLTFKNAAELGQAIVKSPETRACYATQWWRYAFGRAETQADSCALSVLAKSLENDSYTTADLLVDMTRTQTFMFRNAEGQ